MRTSSNRLLAGCIGSVLLATGTAATAAADPRPPTAAEAPTGERAGEQTSPAEDHRSGPTIAGTCGDTFTPTINGAEARWTLHCDKPPLINRLTGYVKDTRMDGYGAILKFMDSKGRVFFMPQARGWGEVNEFDIDVGRAQIDGELSIGW